jgi:S-adenosylmethionine:diacylglycerol 3-amino-3-carboxypropyl transferase
MGSMCLWAPLAVLHTWPRENFAYTSPEIHKAAFTELLRGTVNGQLAIVVLTDYVNTPKALKFWAALRVKLTPTDDGILAKVMKSAIAPNQGHNAILPAL